MSDNYTFLSYIYRTILSFAIHIEKQTKTCTMLYSIHCTVIGTFTYLIETYMHKQMLVYVVYSHYIYTCNSVSICYQ